MQQENLDLHRGPTSIDGNRGAGDVTPGGHVDNAPPVTRPHPRQSQTDGVEGRRKVHGKILIPVVRGIDSIPSTCRMTALLSLPARTPVIYLSLHRRCWPGVAEAPRRERFRRWQRDSAIVPRATRSASRIVSADIVHEKRPADHCSRSQIRGVAAMVVTERSFVECKKRGLIWGATADTHRRSCRVWYILASCDNQTSEGRGRKR